MTSFPAVYDQIDARTLDLLERRKRSNRFKRRGWLVRRALLAADVVGLLAAFLVTEAFLGQRRIPHDQIGQIGEYAMFFAALPLWILAAKVYGLYDRDEERTNHSTADDFAGVFQLMTITVWLLRAGTYVAHVGRPDFAKLFFFWLLAITFVSLARAGGRAFCRRQIEYIQNTVIVGGGEVGRSLAERILRHREYGLNVVGFVTIADEDMSASVDLRVLGELADLPELVRLLDIERVIVASDGHDDPDFIRRLNDTGVQVDVVPRFHEVISSDIDIHMIEGIPVVGLPPFDLSRSSRYLKRGFDLLGSLVGIIILSPLLLVVALAIKCDSRGGVFFRQVRIGVDDQAFTILKFRTMFADAERRKEEFSHLNKHAADVERRMFKIDDDPRVTRIGRVLRRWSIDELAQLWNVLRGEMSLVGPRPLIPEEQMQVRNWEAKRVHLRPGMTGLWQVLGRDDIPFAEMVRLDYVYVTTWSLFTDIRLIMRTLPVLVRGSRAR